MIIKSLKVQNRLGVHARPSGYIVDITSQSASEVTFVFGDTRANAKSILNLMMLAIPPEAVIQVEIDGEDEQKTMDELENLFKEKFHENDEEEC